MGNNDKPLTLEELNRRSEQYHDDPSNPSSCGQYRAFYFRNCPCEKEDNLAEIAEIQREISLDTALLRIGGLAWPEDHRILRRRIAANLAKLDTLTK